MSKEVMDAFIEKVANDEIVRADLIANPAEVLARWDLNEEELFSVKHANAWARLRELWSAPPNW